MNHKNLLAIVASLATCGSGPISCNQTEISVLTYNVHGLPESVTGTSPAENISQISPLLKPYDIAAIQESFFYLPELFSHDEHLSKTPLEFYQQREEGLVNLSGLTLFSKFPIGDYHLERWYSCSGTY